jgi:hypothetical protein
MTELTTQTLGIDGADIIAIGAKLATVHASY